MPRTKITAPPPPRQVPATGPAALIRKGNLPPNVLNALADLVAVAAELDQRGMQIPTVLAAGFEAVLFQLRMPADEPKTQLMTVRVVDRSERGAINTIRTITIPATCPTCGGPRGEAQPFTWTEDGEDYTADIWKNRCGHGEGHQALLVEGRRYAELVDVEGDMPLSWISGLR